MRDRQLNERKIIVVDDEAPFRDMIHQVLSRDGYTVGPAVGVEEALKTL